MINSSNISECFSWARARLANPLSALNLCLLITSTLTSESVKYHYDNTISMFMFRCAFNFMINHLFAEDDVCKEVSVNIDGEETRIIFVDHKHGEMSVSGHRPRILPVLYPVMTRKPQYPQVENQVGTYTPDAFLIVFAVDDEPSLEQAERILRYLRPELGGRPCILVANKTDLVRNRVVRTGGEFNGQFPAGLFTQILNRIENMKALFMNFQIGIEF